MVASKVISRKVCPNCSMSNLEGSPYCSQCGAPMSQVAVAPMQPQPMEAIDAIKNFLNEEQDAGLVGQIYQKALQIMEYGEEIEYIATANKTMAGFVPNCVVATNRRLIDYKKKILGKMELDDCLWRDVNEFQTREARHGVVLIVETIRGWRLTVDSLPRAQAWKLYEVGAKYNLKLQMKLQQRLDAPSASVPDVLPSFEHEGPIVSTPTFLQDDQLFAQQRPEPASLLEPKPPRPSHNFAADPLPHLVLPASESAALHDKQAQSGSGQGRLNGLSESASSAPPPMNDLDDLFSALLTKDRLGSKHPEERVANGPASKAQPDPARPDDQPAERLSFVPTAAGHLVNYQMSPPHQPRAGVTNGINGSNGANGSNGNGELHLHMNNGLLTVGVAHAEPAPITPTVTEAQASQTPVAQEPKRANIYTEMSTRGTEPQKTSSRIESPMRKLRQLKRMLDIGLITQADYEAKKVDILSRM
jgi:hypothetical protein